jgi:uncharacterized protein YoxC
MFGLILAANPILETGGQIAAVIICIFLLVLVVVILATHLVLAIGFSWVRDKTELIKLLRPQVEMVNDTTRTAIKGEPLSQDTNAVVRTAAALPAQVQALDKRVDGLRDRTARAAIEVRARTVQAQTIVRAFLRPPLKQQGQVETARESDLEFKSPGYRSLIERQAPEIPVETRADESYEHAIPSEQLRNVPSR